jgi:hypothetical protein
MQLDARFVLALCLSALLAASCTPARRPAPAAAWVLRFDGIGAVQVGMALAEVERIMGEAARIERIEPGERCGFAYFASLPAGVALMLDGDTVVRVDVSIAGVLTEAGAGLGSAESDVVNRYAKMIRVEPHPYTGPEGHYLIADDPAHPHMRIIFETDGSVVTGMRAGRIPEVDLIEGCA